MDILFAFAQATIALAMLMIGTVLILALPLFLRILTTSKSLLPPKR